MTFQMTPDAIDEALQRLRDFEDVQLSTMPLDTGESLIRLNSAVDAFFASVGMGFDSREHLVSGLEHHHGAELPETVVQLVLNAAFVVLAARDLAG